MTESVLAWLDQLSAEFDRAVRTDPAYVIEFAQAGSTLKARRDARTLGAPVLEVV